VINFAIELAACLIWWCVFLLCFCEALSSTQHHNCWRALARVAVLPFVLYHLFFQVADSAVASVPAACRKTLPQRRHSYQLLSLQCCGGDGITEVINATEAGLNTQLSRVQVSFEFRDVLSLKSRCPFQRPPKLSQLL
jgi:hypothetical protein